MKYYVRNRDGVTISAKSKKEAVKTAYHFAQLDMFRGVYGTEYHVFQVDGFCWISDVMFSVGYENGLTLYRYDNKGRHVLRHWDEY